MVGGTTSNKCSGGGPEKRISKQETYGGGGTSQPVSRPNIVTRSRSSREGTPLDPRQQQIREGTTARGNMQNKSEAEGVEFLEQRSSPTGGVPEESDSTPQDMAGISSADRSPPISAVQMPLAQSHPAPSDTSSSGSSARVPSFLTSLLRMVTVEDPSVIAYHDGNVIVNDPIRLASDLLPRYFRHSKFASFQRQLHYFGFRKIVGKGRLKPAVFFNFTLQGTVPESILSLRRRTRLNAEESNQGTPVVAQPLSPYTTTYTDDLAEGRRIPIIPGNPNMGRGGALIGRLLDSSSPPPPPLPSDFQQQRFLSRGQHGSGNFVANGGEEGETREGVRGGLAVPGIPSGLLGGRNPGSGNAITSMPLFPPQYNKGRPGSTSFSGPQQRFFGGGFPGVGSTGAGGGMFPDMDFSLQGGKRNSSSLLGSPSFGATGGARDIAMDQQSMNIFSLAGSSSVSSGSGSGGGTSLMCMEDLPGGSGEREDGGGQGITDFSGGVPLSAPNVSSVLSDEEMLRAIEAGGLWATMERLSASKTPVHAAGGAAGFFP